MTDNRATGWKIPLLFCGVIISIVAVAALFRPQAQEPPAIPGALLQKAKGIRIDLESDTEGRSWKARIASAASGFSTQADKDGRLGEIVLTTAENKRFDASCTAAVLIRDDGVRDGLMRKIADAAAGDCASLPWGVFAMHGMRAPQAQAEIAACSRNAGKNAMKERNREQLRHAGEAAWTPFRPAPKAKGRHGRPR